MLFKNIDPLISSSSSSSGKRDRSSSVTAPSNISSLYNTNHKTESIDPNTFPVNTTTGYKNKRMKSVTAATTTTTTTTTTHLTLGESNHRLFGDEISTNNTTIDEFFQRTHHRDGSMISKADTDNGTVTSDCGTTEGSVVAQLRGKLQDFEQKNHSHFLKNSIVPSKEELEKPLRPKVKPSIKEKPGPTPLPKHAADALVRRMGDQTTGSITATASSAASTPSIFRQRSTPVRLRIKATPSENVQATNEGYASVAKLSKWLADDPTSTKKVKQLRRGANIIAKSRKFDKVLANAEIEHVIPRNCVTRSKILLQQALSSDDGDDMFNNYGNDINNSNTIDSQPTKTATPDWMKLGTTASLSVSDKKKWLSNAFQNTGSTESNETTGSVMQQVNRSTPMKVGKARTEIVSSSVRNSDLGNLAKEKWRQQQQQRTPTKVPIPPKSQTLVAPTNTISSSSQMNIPCETQNVIMTSNFTTESVKRNNGRLSSHNDLTKSIVNDNNTNGSSVVDFHLARDMLVQRSKANGNNVDVMNAFQRRKARFQQLEKVSVARRQSSITTTSSSSLYKTTWDTTNTANGYVKTLKEDIAPKKSWTDLP